MLRKLDFTTGEYQRAFIWLEELRPRYHAASEEVQQHLSTVLLPFETNRVLEAIKPMHEEATNDLHALKRLRPLLFPFL